MLARSIADGVDSKYSNLVQIQPLFTSSESAQDWCQLFKLVPPRKTHLECTGPGLCDSFMPGNVPQEFKLRLVAVLVGLVITAVRPSGVIVLQSTCQCNTLAANRHLSGDSLPITASRSRYPESSHSVVLLAAMQNHHPRPVWLSPLRLLGGDIMSASRPLAANQPGLLDLILSLPSLRCLRPILIRPGPDLV